VIHCDDKPGELDQDNDDGGDASRKRACHQRREARERPEAIDISASTIGRSTSADSVAVAASARTGRGWFLLESVCFSCLNIQGFDKSYYNQTS
jgi:hypothetical protein